MKRKTAAKAVLGTLIALSLAGCKSTSEQPSDNSNPTNLAIPESSPTVPPAAMAIIDGINRGADSIKKRFTPEQISELRKEYLAADRKRIQMVEEAIQSGKIVKNGKMASDYNAFLEESNTKTLIAFQKKHALSDEEISAISSGTVQ